MPSRDKICCKKLVKRDNGIIVAEVEMTKDTKYLDDKNKDGNSILTEDMLKRLDESYERVKKRLANPNYKPSRAVQRMHTIWQMESDYFNEQRQKWEKINKFYFNHQYDIIEATYATKEFCLIFFWKNLLVVYRGILWVTK